MQHDDFWGNIGSSQDVPILIDDELAAAAPAPLADHPVREDRPKRPRVVVHPAADAAEPAEPDPDRPSVLAVGDNTNAVAWFFTWFVEPGAEQPDVALRAAGATWRYLVYQKERAPSTGKLHWQGFLVFAKRTKFSWWKTHFPEVHVSYVANTKEWLKCSRYCKKRDKPGVEEAEAVYEDGSLERPQAEEGKRGKRNDLDLFVEWLGEQKTEPSTEDVITAGFAPVHAKYTRWVQDRISKKFDHERDEPVRCICWWGETGTGKSVAARKFCRDNNLDYYTKLDDSFWYDGYSGEPVILFDEFRGDGGQVKIGQLLALLDYGKPPRVQVKGSTASLSRVRYVLFTSPVHPHDWYSNVGDDNRKGQLIRRFSEFGQIIHKRTKPAAVAPPPRIVVALDAGDEAEF